MGSKQTWNWKHLFLHLTCGVTLLPMVSACIFHDASSPPIASPALETEAPAEVADLEKIPPDAPDEIAWRHLVSARLALGAEEYNAALEEIEAAFDQATVSMHSEALYITGILYADPRNPSADPLKASEILKRIEQDFPQSERAGEGRIVSELLARLTLIESENERLNQAVRRLEKQLAAEKSSVRILNEMLKKMKAIDLGTSSEE